MKILYWSHEFHPAIGGVEELARQLLPALQKRDHEFLVVASHGTEHVPDLMDFNGIPVHRFHFWDALQKSDSRKILLYQKQIARLKQSFDPDLVHFHFVDACAYFHATTAAAHPAPSIVTLHSIADSRIGPETLLGKLLTQAAWVVGVSAATLAPVRQSLPEIRNRSSVIYNGVALPALRPEPLSFNPAHMLCLGRAVGDKGFDLAIAAFASVRKKFPTSRLVIAGDGLARAELEQQAAGLGLSESVDFLGWVDPDDVPALINRAAIVLVPSRSPDAFPYVALQAAQMARPVVAARVGGLSESVVHGETGLLVDTEDPQQLADGINLLLTRPDLAAGYGRSARDRAREVFSLDGCLEAYDALYKMVAGGVVNVG